jgi:hypothetical protein
MEVLLVANLGRDRLWTGLLLVAALTALVLLSAGLSDVQLPPGRPFPLGWLLSFETDLAIESSGQGASWLVQILRVVFTLAIIMLPFSLVYVIVSPTARKRVLRDIGVYATLAFVLYSLVRAGAERQPSPQGPSGAPGALNLSGVGAPAFSPSPPPWLITAVSLGLVLSLMLLIGSIAWLLWRRTAEPEDVLAPLAQEAQTALDDLRAGGDVRDTVMRCYVEMSRTVADTRGVRRQLAVTPREFEGQLERAGLPGPQVRRLTRLFEDVRYGSLQPGDAEMQEAVACLTAIVDACRRPQ